jgi:hypothetical protein
MALSSEQPTLLLGQMFIPIIGEPTLASPVEHFTQTHGSSLPGFLLRPLSTRSMIPGIGVLLVHQLIMLTNSPDCV